MTEYPSAYTVGWFIDTALLRDLGCMILECHLHYLGFGVVANGIEFLGACLDDLDFGARGVSEQRFNAAVLELFPPTYTACTDSDSGHYLYGALRCGMAHTLSPGLGVQLTAVSDGADPSHHLRHTDGGILLVSEVLYTDFAAACHQLRSGLHEGRYGKQMNSPYLRIGPVSFDA